jgi:hypothetical protein
VSGLFLALVASSAGAFTLPSRFPLKFVVTIRAVEQEVQVLNFEEVRWHPFNQKYGCPSCALLTTLALRVATFPDIPQMFDVFDAAAKVNGGTTGGKKMVEKVDFTQMGPNYMSEENA